MWPRLAIQMRYYKDSMPRTKEQHNAKMKAWRTRNKEHYNEYQRAYRAGNSDKLNELRRARYRPLKSRWECRKHQYGLTGEQWFAMFKAQGECCAICRSTDRGGPQDWATDHDHATGKVRGILCHRCNKALGLFKDNPDVMRQAALYIERSTDDDDDGSGRQKG